MSELTAKIAASAKTIADRIDGDIPKTVLVLGSGLGSFVESMTVNEVIDYSDIEHFPQPTVQGHEGKLIIGEAGGTPLICMQGRMHAYEGHAPRDLAITVRTFKALGCENLILTNAAGSVRNDMGPGSLMVIQDHINWCGVNPLIGANDERDGPRFPDMTQAYDLELQQQLHSAAKRINKSLFEGVYLMAIGPNFETPAEIKMFRTLGADAVGMSTVPECLVANHCGMRVAGVSMISNFGAGMGDGKITHDETLSEGAKAAGQLSEVLIDFFAHME